VRSESRALFFNGFPTTAGPTHAPRRLTINALYFRTSAPNCHTVEPGDCAQELNAAAPPLKCEQSGKSPPVFFIQPCQQAIDGAMLFGSRAIWMLLTGFTSALMNRYFSCPFHSRSL